MERKITHAILIGFETSLPGLLSSKETVTHARVISFEIDLLGYIINNGGRELLQI